MTTETPLRAFHNTPSIKDFYVHRLRAHCLTGTLKQYTAWNGTSGGVLSCTLHGDDSASDTRLDLTNLYATHLGLPTWAAQMHDWGFRNLADRDEREGFAVNFLTEIPVGAELHTTYATYMHGLFTHPEYGVQSATFGVPWAEKLVTDVDELLVRTMEGGNVSRRELYQHMDKVPRSSGAMVFKVAEVVSHILYGRAGKVTEQICDHFGLPPIVACNYLRSLLRSAPVKAVSIAA